MKRVLAMILAAVLALTAAICGAAAEDEWKDFTCAEEQFITKVPAAAVSRYETDNGLVVYTEHEGYIPNLIVHRRTGDMKLKNPTNFLNNVYREYLENKYGDDSRGMNPAKTWDVGGKELLGARYMFMIGEYSVVQLVLIELRDAGDVEYIVKYIDGQGDAILAATEEAVRNYRETDMDASETVETGMVDDSVPKFMIPSFFTARFNALMEALADQYAEQLGEEGARIVKEDYTITQEDPTGEIIYYGNNDWSVEAGFLYGDAASASENAPALILNYTIKAGIPDGAVFLSKYAIRMMIAYDFQDQVSLDDLTNWFDNAEDMGDIFTLPGYTLNVYKTDEQLTYAVIPPAEKVPQLQNVQEAEQ